MTTGTNKLRGFSNAVTFAIALFIAVLISSSASAVEIKRVKSPGGIEALLVEDYTVPLIALSISFRGGATQDLDGKEGTSSLLSTLLDEGAGEIDSQAFQARMDELGIELGFTSATDSFIGTLKTLRSTRAEAFEMFKLALQKPRFDKEPVGRMKAALLTSLRQSETRPNAIAGKIWREIVFAGHTYARPSKGTVKSMTALERTDVIDLHARIIGRDTMKIGVVGAISPEELAKMLDEVFLGLPEKSQLREIGEAKVHIGGGTRRVALNVPQSIIRMALPGVKRDDPDFYAAYLMNHILGGGSFSSRLYNEVREKRGLAYGVYSYLATLDHAGAIGAGSATRNDRAAQTIEIMRKEIKRMAEEGPTAKELEQAKKYIIGSYAINNLDSSTKIAQVLVAIQTENLGVDYIERRGDYISAVTLEKIKSVAKRLLSVEPTIIIVGPADT